MNKRTDGVDEPRTLIEKTIWFCLNNKLVLFILLLLTVGWGMLVAPFDWPSFGLTRHPVPVDAIPDIGENQQIVFTEWMGRSPQDVEDQVTYPMTTAMLGIPGVKTVRSYSYFGFSTIYVIFKEGIDFYWSRSRILEKLNGMGAGMLPEGVRPTLGPDATALGQIFWYTLEGRDPDGNPTGGWDLHELRSAQDWYVRYGLLAAEGVSEVASAGGFVKEYQVDVNPEAMRAHGVTLSDVLRAVALSNQDVGARNIEINNVEYFIRGLGFIRQIEDIEHAVVKANQGVPIYVKDVARVALGPAQRRGLLEKGGAEAVGGVVVARFGENPLQVIESVKQKIAEMAPGMPSKVLADGTASQLVVVPFYDRSGLIHETLDTLNTALSHEMLVTIIVILVMLMNLRSSLLVSGLLPLAVLMTFIAMKHAGVDANIVALSGIAIAIGTMVDMGIVVVENITRHLRECGGKAALQTIYRAAVEVAGAVLTAVATTVIGFLPVFTLQAAEGKLFRPLAFTKTFALLAAVVVAIVVIPPLAHLLFGAKRRGAWVGVVILLVGPLVGWWLSWWLLPLCLLLGAYRLWGERLPERWRDHLPMVVNIAAAMAVAFVLAKEWLPLGPGGGFAANYFFVLVVIGGILLFFLLFQWCYPVILTWAMRHRWLFLSLPAALVVWGLVIWLGFGRIVGWLPETVQQWRSVQRLEVVFPGLGKEFMPPLDEGSYLFMPTTSVHAAIGEAGDVLKTQGMSLYRIPEVASAVGKIGRAETPLDPAPISMIETIINYHPEYLLDERGHRLTFRYQSGENDFMRSKAGSPVAALDGKPYRVRGRFIRDDQGNLIADPQGMPFRLWRLPLERALNAGREAWAGIRNPDDIWDEIVRAGKLPGTTSAPKLQPIAARIVMLQSGMRAPMGIKIKGPDLETIEEVGLQLERMLKQVPSVKASAVIADRIIGKPYLEFHIDRKAIARYGIVLADVQQVLEVAIGGKRITTTVEGRERYPVRVRYQRELRDTLSKLGQVLVPTPSGAQIPLTQISDLNYVRGPQVIKSEDTFLLGYVIFDKRDGHAEVDVVEEVQAYIEAQKEAGTFLQPNGVSLSFAGSYENQRRATNRLKLVVPVALLLIFLILYLQFRSVMTTLLVFSAIGVACSGGFIMIWLYGQGWFLDFTFLGANLRDLFDVTTVNLSVAVWVGFLALFGIATDDGVIIATYLEQHFGEQRPATIEAIREAALQAGIRRARPALMTVATTVIALIPVLTSTGRGADIMKPMAIPTFGGMSIVIITIFVVPVLYSLFKEMELARSAA